MESDPLRIPRLTSITSRALRLAHRRPRLPRGPLRGWRVSRRLRDLVIGLTILVVGPVAAIALATGAAGGGAAPASASVPALSVPAVHVPSIPPAHLDVTAATPTPVPQASAPAAPPQVMYQPVTPTPAPTYTTAQIVAIITAAAETYGVDPGWMISTATCESNLRPDAYNPSGPYVGIFQFLPSTFAAHGGTDIWDPVQQSEIAASMFAGGDSSAWPVCSLR